MFENLPAVCYHCGRIGHVDEVCQFIEGDPSGGNCHDHLSVDNVVALGGDVLQDAPPPSVVEGPSADNGDRSRLDLWIVTSHIYQPWASRAPVRARREPEKPSSSCSDSSEPHSSFPGLSFPRNTSPPNFPLDSDGWQKSIKVAQRQSPGTCSGDAVGDEAAVGAGYSALGPLFDEMDLCLGGEQGVRDAIIDDPSPISLKRA